MTRRVAIVHEYLHQYGGGERVLEALHELYPESDVYTLVYDDDVLPQYATWNIYASILNKIRWARKRPQYWCLLFPILWRLFSLSRYDIVIVSTHAWATSIRTRGVKTLAYCHTPVRYFWDLFDEYARNKYLPLGVRIIMYVLKRPVRWYDRWRARGIDTFLVNSQEVSRRVQCSYAIQPTIVYPPVDVDFFSACVSAEKDDYYLIVTRLKAYKRVDLVVEAFSRMHKRLIVVGSGPEEASLRDSAGETIEFCAGVSDEELRDLYCHARGYVYMANEDFGMSMAEAHAAGCPVIAFRKGGACEIVIERETGIFVDEQTAECLCDMVGTFETMTWDSERISSQAARFSKRLFLEQMQAHVAALCEEAVS